MDELTVEFEQLLAEARSGDQAAMGELYRRYSNAVRLALHFRMPRLLRLRHDSGDLMQSVWASFLRVPRASLTFDTPEKFVAFLTGIARHKVADLERRYTSLKRDHAREVSLDSATPDEDPLVAALPGSVPTPSKYMIAQECWQKIIAGLPPVHVRVLELIRDGHSQVEIAERLKINLKFIQRLVNRLRDHMEQV
jgi:RNA polymerase sigma-70 factor (ECF subfamily)